MTKRHDYEHAGSMHFYRRKPKPPNNPWPTIILVGLAILFLVGSCVG